MVGTNTEIYTELGDGKNEFCMTLAVNAQIDNIKEG